jgi:hypothetical protein
MNYGRCKICCKKNEYAFKNLILNKYNGIYVVCKNCGFLSVSNPIWLDEAYKDAIVDFDTGILERNIAASKKISLLFSMIFNQSSSYIDIAGGYGVFTRLMRDNGLNYYWHDKYCKNILAKGFEYEFNTKHVDAITAFEVIEHVEDPLKFINENLLRFKTDTIIISTQCYGRDIPDNSWWYLSSESGQHISFYQKKTLKIISSKLGLNFYEFSGLYIFTKQKLRFIWFLRIIYRLGIRVTNNSKAFDDLKMIKKLHNQ